MTELNLYKFKYYWCEGEEQTTYLAKNVNESEFLTDLAQALEFANSLRGTELETNKFFEAGKNYGVECLPEYYAQVIYYMTEKLKYYEIDQDDRVEYILDDHTNGLTVQKREETVKFETVLEKVKK